MPVPIRGITKLEGDCGVRGPEHMEGKRMLNFRTAEEEMPVRHQEGLETGV